MRNARGSTLEITSPLVPYTTEEFLLFLDFTIIIMALILGFIASARLGLTHLSLIRRYKTFVSSVSHEFRTPVAGIKLYSEMLIRGRFQSEKDQVECGEFILEEAERLNRLVEGLLELAKADEQLELSTVTARELTELVHDAVNKLSWLANKSGHEIEVQSDVSPNSRFALHRDGLVVILSNLIENALKFSKDSEVKRVVVSLIENSPSELTLKVQDYGPGLPDGDPNELFSYFSRGKDEEENQVSGTGIGLSLVKELAAKMKSSVFARDWKEGAEFGLKIPVSS